MSRFVTKRPVFWWIRAAAACCIVASIAVACGTEPTQPPAQSTADAAGTDAVADAAVDAGKPVVAEAPKAKVYFHDPTTDQLTTAQVTLVRPTTADGTLTGPYASVKNCLNEKGGQTMASLGYAFGALCKEVATVVPDADGHYLSIKPPTDMSDPNDGFAELMMYHHVNQIHAYFKNVHGLTELDHPLPALVNVNLWYDPEIAKTHGLAGGWTGYPNAAFMPPKGFKAFQLPERDKGHIIFGQYEKTDFSYDATVIYHEYTHAMVGTTRLSGLFADAHGLNNQPGAMNEGFADYFAAAMIEYPIIGTYGLAFAGAHRVRDLSVMRKCPDDLTGQVHADGRIFSSALWAIRKKVGSQLTDHVILRALLTFTNHTSFEAAAKLIIAEAEKLDSTKAGQMELLLKKYGLIGCLRGKELKTWSKNNSPDKTDFQVEGGGKLGGGYKFGVPAYLQWRLPVKQGTQAVRIRWHAESSGTFNNPNLTLALQFNAPVTISGIDGGKVFAHATVVPEPDKNKSKWQSITLAGKCIPYQGGNVWMLLLNHSLKDVRIDEIEVDVLPTVPQSGENLALCNK
ncbi:MAG: M36 family metallopeptidase [Myxococcales bacterium]|nr:M36 family metallopeptidase [Myxococcales bacterium]